MSSHPAVAGLISKHGNTAEGRKKARAEIRRALVADMERTIAAAGRSMRCRQGDHLSIRDGQPDGCRNDGTNCVCECHDGGRP